MSDPKSDGGVAVETSRDELYSVVRRAVRDAMLDVVGTVFLLGIALLFVAIGGQIVLGAASNTARGIGATVVVLGLVLGFAAVDYVPGR
jgi:hypothetical protein